MTTLLSTRGRKLALEIDRRIADGDTSGITRLIAEWGITESERRDVARSLMTRSDDEVTFRYDAWDRAHVRDVPEVWRRGLDAAA